MKRILTEERRRSSGESQKLFDVQTFFGQVILLFRLVKLDFRSRSKICNSILNSHF